MANANGYYICNNWSELSEEEFRGRIQIWLGTTEEVGLQVPAPSALPALPIFWASISESLKSEVADSVMRKFAQD